MPRATSIAVARAGYGLWMRTARNLAVLCTGLPRPPIWLSVGLTGRPCIAPRATNWGLSTRRSRVSRCRVVRSEHEPLGPPAPDRDLEHRAALIVHAIG